VQEIENRIANLTRTTNKYLKRIGEQLGIPVKLTLSTARHSFATKLKNSEKVSLSFIMESLGHSSIKTTMDYHLKHLLAMKQAGNHLPDTKQRVSGTTRQRMAQHPSM